jgi:hypothetical protein
VIAMLLRDGFRGRSIGKHLLGLRLLTPRGEGCGYGRSVVRNIPLIIPAGTCSKSCWCSSASRARATGSRKRR